MSGAPQEQRNPYKGTPPRSWIRIELVALDGTVQSLELLADTGSPFLLIVSDGTMRRFAWQPAPGRASSFGQLPGGVLRVAIPQLGFDSLVVGFASDALVREAQVSSPDFEGLAGLPFLRMVEYGGDADWFWIRPQGSNP